MNWKEDRDTGLGMVWVCDEASVDEVLVCSKRYGQRRSDFNEQASFVLDTVTSSDSHGPFFIWPTGMEWQARDNREDI